MMKQCLVCKFEGEPPNHTCPSCGEDSWSEIEAEVVFDDHDEIQDEDPS